MRLSKLFGKTLREEPAEAELTSHKLMLRAGGIYQVASGVYSYLQLAWRSLRKIEEIIRQEMDAEGGQELRMPTLQPREIWDQTGRTAAFGPDLFQVTDRKERPLVIAPTHEEVLTMMVRANVRSYRDLPLTLYQIQTKFRDAPRPRGGLIRVREFDMKDAYSFHADWADLDTTYQAMVKAYNNIFRRCGLNFIMVEADRGAIGGKDSNEFMALSDAGEDTLIVCGRCSYAANAEKASFVKPPPDFIERPRKLEDVHTPGLKTIDELAEFLEIETMKTLKAVFYMADGKFTFVVIRGDLDINEVKLKNTLKVRDLRIALPEEVKANGIVAGSASPVGVAGVRVIADDPIKLGANWVVGANRPDYHIRNANLDRDFTVDLIADIAQAREGDECVRCGGPLATKRGIEVGHVFKLGTRYSDALNAVFADQSAAGEQHPIIMGCYGIGVGRLLAVAIEQNNDEKGIVFPREVAPWQVHLAALNVDKPEVAEAADALYRELTAAGVEVLYDDRVESAGVKFNDADLIGLPVRLVVSPRNLKQGVVEVKARKDGQGEAVAKEQVVVGVKGMF
ncbi:MAG: proline--tRNA ligase [SAR202 cluster bacterium]|nr:proline--tRNA ligase [SAR202 cluster bacterium]